MNNSFRTKILLILSVICIIFGLTGCSINKSSSDENLLEHIPQINTSAYNRFLFTMDVIEVNEDNSGEEFSMKGAVELQEKISHMYNLDVHFLKSGYKAKAETWADFQSETRHTDTGNGFVIDKAADYTIIDCLMNAINNRDKDIVITADDSVCTISWTFPTDNNHLFDIILENPTTDMEGYGRITAILEPETYELQYITFVISVSNEKREGALLDAIFYWDTVNDSTTNLIIPDNVSSSAYEIATGISTNGGYDDVINPMAEDFIKTYKGTANVSHYEDGASMFWTLENEGISATVNYAKKDNPATLYDEHHSVLLSVYESSVEETENEAYFYDSAKAELTYIAKGDDWYAEIIITGSSDMSQGELRKHLITYKSKLGV